MQLALMLLKYGFVVVSRGIERVTNRVSFRFVCSQESFSKAVSLVDSREVYQLQRSRRIQRIKEEFHQGFDMCS